MNKTLHQKLTDKHQYTFPAHIDMLGADDLIPGFRLEKQIFKEADKDLLSPRPQAIAHILELSRSI